MRMLSRVLLIAAIASLAAFASACGDDEEEGGSSAATEQRETAQQGGEDIVSLAQGEESLSTLVDAVAAAKLVGTLEGEGPFTVFAPTNQAFDAVGEEQLNELLKPENRAQLKALLTYHVVPGELTADRLRDGQEVETVQGETLAVSVDGNSVKVNDATVAQADVDASNGVVHVIDGVLTPTS